MKKRNIIVVLLVVAIGIISIISINNLPKNGLSKAHNKLVEQITASQIESVILSKYNVYTIISKLDSNGDQFMIEIKNDEITRVFFQYNWKKQNEVVEFTKKMREQVVFPTKFYTSTHAILLDKAWKQTTSNESNNITINSIKDLKNMHYKNAISISETDLILYGNDNKVDQATVFHEQIKFVYEGIDNKEMEKWFIKNILSTFENELVLIIDNFEKVNKLELSNYDINFTYHNKAYFLKLSNDNQFHITKEEDKDIYNYYFSKETHSSQILLNDFIELREEYIYSILNKCNKLNIYNVVTTGDDDMMLISGDFSKKIKLELFMFYNNYELLKIMNDKTSLTWFITDIDMGFRDGLESVINKLMETINL